MNPDRIEQYEIVEELGAGAFGTVYLARDTVLERPAVIKLLRPAPRGPSRVTDTAGARARVLEEARIASAIEHPNVCAVYEVGEHEGQPFIAMQYVPGSTLKELLRRGPLNLRSVLSFGIQIADGLAAAHRLGILHRDLKPSNIMIADGVVKILDFGLARRTPSAPDVPSAEVADADAIDADAADAPAGERPGPPSDRFGTTAYMAPEQFVRRKSSERSDIFSLGVILYEMVTRRHPFLRPNMDPLAVPSAIQTTRPPPPTSLRPALPPALEAVILKAMAKQPASRLRYASDVSESLKAVMRSLELETGLVPGEMSAVLPAPSTVTPERPGLVSELVRRFLPARRDRIPENSIATLPFRAGDDDPGARLYGFTLSNAVATRLARVPDLLVRPLSAYLSVASRSLDPLEAGRELQVERVLVGTFTRAEDRLVLDWQLLDVASGAIRAGGTITVASTEMAVVQDRVAEEIVSLLRTSDLLGQPRPVSTSARSEDLPDDVREELLVAQALLAGFALRSGTADDLDRARAAYERILDRAPDSAAAHAGLGTVYLRSARNGFGGVEHLRAAERHLTIALEVDPGLIEARLYRASTMIWAGEKDSARLELQDLLRTAPPDADIHLAAAVILQLDGLPDEALRLQSDALRLNPAVAPRVYYYRSRSLLYQGRTEPARQQVDMGLAIERGHTLLRHVKGFIHLLQGDLERAITTLEAVLADAPNLRIVYPTLAMAYTRAGRPGDAAALITEELLDAAAADAETAYRVASYFALIDEAQRALAWLRLSILLGNENHPWIAANSAWDGLRRNDEFQGVLAELEEVRRMNRVRWEGVLESLPGGA